MMVYVGVHVFICLKEKLALAKDKRLRVITNVMLFKVMVYLLN